MSAAFDRYDRSYAQVVQDSIAFSGLPHDFFLAAKVERLAALFARHFGDVRPSLIDVGCGIGRMHPMLQPICGAIAGSDPSGDCIAEAAAANPAVTYTQAVGQNVPLADGAFDVSLAVCVYHHVPPAERQALVAEMRRVVRPGGLVVVIEHNPWNPLTRLAVARCPFDHDANLLDWRACERLLAAADLKQPQSEHFLLLPFAGAISAWAEARTAGLPVGAQYMTSGRVPEVAR